MTTPIVPVPDLVLAPDFPTAADRPAGNYNSKAIAWAAGENAMATSVKAIADATRTNAQATEQIAQDAAQAGAQAVQDAQDAALAAAAAVGAAAAERDKAQAWAESDDAPVPGAKSAKSHAADAGTAAQSAWNAAAAAGESAGLPEPLVPGKVLGATDAGVAWVDSIVPGDVLQSHRPLAAPAWLPADGKSYLRSAYPKVEAQFGSPGLWIRQHMTNPGSWGTPVTDGQGTWVIPGIGQIARSTDNGVTWTTISVGHPDQGWNKIDTDGQGTWVIGGTYYNPYNAARSTDNGATWTMMLISNSYQLQLLKTDKAGTWLAALYNGASQWPLLRSTDNGVTWTELTGVSGVNLSAETDNAGTWLLYSFTSPSGTWARSTDNGATWTAISPAPSSFGSACADGNGNWLVIANNSAFLSRNNGISFAGLTFSDNIVYKCGVSNGSLFFAGGTGATYTALLAWLDPSGNFFENHAPRVFSGRITHIRPEANGELAMMLVDSFSGYLPARSIDRGRSIISEDASLFAGFNISQFETNKNGTWVAVENNYIFTRTPNPDYFTVPNLGSDQYIFTGETE